MDGVLNLKNGVVIKELYKDLDQEQIKKIETAAKDGFTVDELKSLEEDGIDTSLIKQNSNEEGSAKEAKTAEDVSNKIQELKEKYCSDLEAYSGDPYKGANPELQALKKMMGDGVLADLADEGFTKTQIIEVVGQAFSSLGIVSLGEGNGYQIPRGRDAQAKEIFSQFQSTLVSAMDGGSEDVKEAREKLKRINNQIAENNHSLQVLEVTVEALQEDVQEQIDAAIEESEEIAEEQKEKVKETVDKRLKEYTNSQGEMTYEQFQSAVSGDLSTLKSKTGRALSDVVLSLVDANRKMGLLKNYVTEMGDLQASNASLTAEALKTKDEIKDLAASGAEKTLPTADPDAQCCDPIGFTDEDTRYDFFVDKDNNGDITNEQEFLGAQDGFNEMSNLDGNGDGMVTADELEGANVKIVKTSKDGSQEIVDASEVFKNSTDGINLSSYQSTNEDIGNGNTLLGTFSATLDGETKEGYQTLDALDWLDDNYEFTDEVEGKGRHAQDIENITESLDFTEKMNVFSQKNEELETKLSEAWSSYGFNEEMTEGITNIQASDAKSKGQRIARAFSEIARKEEAEAQAQEEAKLEEEEKEAQEAAAKSEEIPISANDESLELANPELLDKLEEEQTDK